MEKTIAYLHQNPGPLLLHRAKRDKWEIDYRLTLDNFLDSIQKKDYAVHIIELSVAAGEYRDETVYQANEIYHKLMNKVTIRQHQLETIKRTFHCDMGVHAVKLTKEIKPETPIIVTNIHAPFGNNQHQETVELGAIGLSGIMTPHEIYDAILEVTKSNQ